MLTQRLLEQTSFSSPGTETFTAVFVATTSRPTKKRKASTVTDTEKIQRHFSVLLEKRDRRASITMVLIGSGDNEGGVLKPSESRSVNKFVWEVIWLISILCKMIAKENVLSEYDSFVVVVDLC